LGALGDYLSTLVNPEYLVQTDLDSTYDNVGLGLLKSVGKKKGFKIKIIDGYVEGKKKDEIVKEIKQIRPKYIGFTCYHVNEDIMRYIVSKIKISMPEVVCFAGGEHCTYTAKTLLARNFGLTFVVCGEGESSLYRALSHLQEGKPLVLVDGIFWRDEDGSIIKNSDRSIFSDISTIPWPARDSVIVSRRKNRKITIGVSTLRGCHGKCSFCNAHSFFSIGGGRHVVRRRAAKDVVAEIAFLKRNHFKLGVAEQIFFYDSHFFHNTNRDKKWLHDFILLMKKQALYFPFRIYLRTDGFDKSSIRLIQGLKDCGLQEVFLGVESGAEDTIKIYQKNVGLDRVRSSMDILRRLNVLGATQGIVFFQPYCTIDSIRKSARVLRDLGLAMYWNYSQKLRLFPGIRIVDDLRKEGLLMDSSGSSDVYYYRFKDSRVEKIFKLMSANNEPFVVKEGVVIRNIISNMSTFMRALETIDLSNRSRSMIKHFADDVELAMKRLYDLNLCYFLSVVDIVETGGNSFDMSGGLFGDLKNSYIQRADKAIDLAGKEYRRFIGKSLEYLKTV